MPAITLGLAEVEERLQALRWRLNALTAQHSVYVAAALTVLLSAAVMVVGLRASPATFRLVAWGSVFLLTGVVFACVSYAWRHWLDAQAVAHLVDERAQLTDRLATLVDLRQRPRPSRLAPVLVAQTLALGTHWQVQRIVPRRIPRSVFFLLAAFLALAGTTSLERATRQPTPQAAATHRDQPVTTGRLAASPALSSGRASGADARGDQGGPQGLGASRAGDVPGTGLEPALEHRSRSDSGAPSAPAQDGPASLTDRLQQAITHAFRAETGGTAPQRGARAGGTSAADAQTQAERAAQALRNDEAGRSPSENARHADRGKGGESPSTKNATQRQGGVNDPQKFEGDSPGVGEGSNPQGLMQGTAGEFNADETGAKPFTLTINSFLRPVEPQGSPLKQPGQRPGMASLAAGGDGAAGALNERQLGDAALRKAAIPAEYEDLVRRVFSRSARR